MGVVQHHDAVSGTEKQEVAFDYAQRLSVGIENAIVSIRIIPFLSLNFKHQSRNTSIKFLQIRLNFSVQYSEISVDLSLLQIIKHVNKRRSC
jgi:hypothetical protein